MTFYFQLFIFELIAYFLGSIPFGLIISKFVKHIDLRNYGSGNIGATNAVRVLNKKWGALVLFLDGMKAVVAILLVKYFVCPCPKILALTACVAVLGHIFPIWLKFKGGKGFACILFSLLFLDYRIGLAILLTWILVFLLSRISSLSALCSIIVGLIVSFFVSKVYFVMVIFLVIITFCRHIANIRRLIKGEESKF